MNIQSNLDRVLYPELIDEYSGVYRVSSELNTSKDFIIAGTDNVTSAWVRMTENASESAKQLYLDGRIDVGELEDLLEVVYTERGDPDGLYDWE